MRRISYSEVHQVLTCPARWDFSYGGYLTGGDTLRSKTLRPILSGGRAWGAAMATWHSSAGELMGAWRAHEALLASLRSDADEHLGARLDVAHQVEQAERLGGIFDHYTATAPMLSNLTRIEDELMFPVPVLNRPNVPSSRYFFHGFLDGFTVDTNGDEWVVEFKLRNRLSNARVLARSRQIRWYAWARQQETGRRVAGVIVDERLNELPKPTRILQNGKISHSTDQATTADLYLLACLETDTEPNEQTLEALRRRKWYQRTHVTFRPTELEEAGRELTSAAKLIRAMDHGELYPIRNASGMTCNFCDYREICDDPHDSFFVDTLFDRRPPKRELT